jgi:uncharacterized protein
MGAWLILLLILSRAAYALVPVPDLTGHVMDLTGTLSDEDMRRLNGPLAAFEAEKGSQVAVLIVPTTKPEEIEQYSIRVVDKWKLGRKKVDDGVLLIVAKDDRTMRLEVGYGLEGVLTDLVSKRIISDVITPRFQAGDFSGGIGAGVQAVLGVIQGEALPPPPPRASGPRGRFGGNGGGLNMGFLIFALVGGVFLKSIFGRMVGGVLAGGFVGVLAAFMMGSVVIGVLLGIVALIFFLAGGGSGFGGGRGGFGGFGGGFGGGGFGGGDGGGFSGGGGGFGGGGASGKW